MTDIIESESANRQQLVVAGICSFVALAANLIDVIVGFGNTDVVTYGTTSAGEWIAIFNRSPFEGLYGLGILNLLYMLSMLPIYWTMVVVHQRTHLLSSIAALLTALLAVGIYVSTNAAIPMMAIANHHTLDATATDAAIQLGAAEAVLARGEDFTPGTFVGLMLSGLAAIVMAAVMLRGSVFSRVNAWVGLIGFTLLSLFTIIATFVPAWYVFAFYLLGGVGGMCALAWFAMTGARFFKLSRP